MNEQPLQWLSDPTFRGEIGASLSLDAEHWRELGAQFRPVADGSGEEPGLAIGRVETTQGELEFGILDYGLEATYLLVPSSLPLEASTAAILSALTHAEALSVPDDVIDDRSGADSEASLEQRVEGMESMVVDLIGALLKQRRPVIPEARVIDLLPSISEETRHELAGTYFRETFERGLGREEPTVLVTGVIRQSNEEGIGIFQPDDLEAGEVLLHFRDLEFHPPQRRWRFALRKGQEEQPIGRRVTVEITLPESWD